MNIKKSGEIAVFGTGLDSVKCTYYLKENGIQVAYYLNNKCNIEKFSGMCVYEPTEENIKNVYILVDASEASYPAISNQLQGMGLNEFDDYIYYEWAYKKVVLLHGNCHMSVIKEYLNSSNQFSKEYSCYPNPPICDNPKRKIADSALATCDLWIHEDIRANNPFGYELSDEYIRSKLRQGTREIIVPHLFGLGKAFFPQADYNSKNLSIANGNDKNGMFPYGDMVIDECVKEGKHKNEIISYLKSEEVLVRDDVLSNFFLYMNKVKEREGGWDIKIYDFIMENYKSKKLFYDHEHPTNIIMKKISMDILECLEIKDENISALFKMDIHEIPVYPIVKKWLGLEWTDENIRKSKMSKKATEIMNFEEYICEYLWWCHGI